MTTNELKPRTLRSSEADLKVILGGNDDDDEQAAILWYNSQTLACKSNYIDTMLSIPMREKDEREISFPDIEPETWNKMMKFSGDCLVSTRQMNFQDVLDVAVYYDKYEFEEGAKVCDHVLEEYFDSAYLREKDLSLNVDLIIDLALISKRANLNNAYKKGIKYIWKKMQLNDIPYGGIMFTIDHLKKLVPLLEDIKNKPHSFEISPYGIYRELERIDDGEFPRRFVTHSTVCATSKALFSSIDVIELSGTRCNADGIFEKYDDHPCSCWEYRCKDARKAWWGVEMVSFSIRKLGNDVIVNNDEDKKEFKNCWAIIRRVIPPPNLENIEDGLDDDEFVIEHCCWVAPCSSNLPLPPQTKWKTVDPLARHQPKIKFILHEELKNFEESIKCF